MKTSHKFLIGAGVILVALYFFAPPLIDMSGDNRSKFQKWIHRNDPLKGVTGAPPEYGAGSDHPTKHTPIPVK